MSTGQGVNNRPLSELWQCNLNDYSWKEIQLASPPEPRCLAMMGVYPAPQSAASQPQSPSGAQSSAGESKQSGASDAGSNSGGNSKSAGGSARKAAATGSKIFVV